MKTATLIKRTFSFLLICVVVFVIKWAYENYSTNEVVRDVVSIVLLFISMGIIITLIGCVVIFFLDLSDGDYDQWFATHTDPIIKKVQDFFNRRNKVLSIIGVIIIFNSCTYNFYLIQPTVEENKINELDSFIPLQSCDPHFGIIQALKARLTALEPKDEVDQFMELLNKI